MYQGLKQKMLTDTPNPQRRDLTLNYLRFINYQLNLEDGNSSPGFKTEVSLPLM